MTELDLRRWVNGELTPDRRREVTRWLVQCTDPDLPALLDGLIRERSEAEADQRLQGLGPVWQRLVNAWNSLLEQGGASWTIPGTQVALASAEGEQPWLRVTLDDPASAIVADVPPNDEVAVYLSTDAPAVHALLPPTRSQQALWPIRITNPATDRATVWAARGTSLPRRDRPDDELLDMLDRDDVEVISVRWDPRDF